MKLHEFHDDHLFYSFTASNGRDVLRGCGYDTFLEYFVPMHLFGQTM